MKKAFLGVAFSVLFIGFLQAQVALQHTIKLENKYGLCADVNDPEDLFAIGCSDNSVEVFSSKSLSDRKTMRKHKSPVKCLLFVPEQNVLCSGSADNSICVWDPKTGEFLYQFTGHKATVVDLVYVPSKRYLFSVSTDETVKVWDIANKRLIKNIFIGNKGGVKAALSKDEQTLIVGTVMKKFISISIKELAIAKEHDVNCGLIADLALAQNDKQLLVANNEAALVSLDLVADTRATEVSNSKGISKVFNPEDTLYYFTAQNDKKFSVWSFQSKEPVFTSDKLDGPITSLTLIDENNLLVTTFSDKAYIWNVSSLGLKSKKKVVETRPSTTRQITPAILATQPMVTGDMPRMYAVIVGISDYKNEKMNLNYADDDAKAYYDFLVSPHGGSLPEDNISLLLNKEATRSAIIKALTQQLRKAQENDMAIVYLACHGMPSQDAAEIFFLASDSEKENIEGTGVGYADVKKLLLNCKATKKILILDACHSGGMEVESDMTRGELSEANYSITNRLLTNVSNQGKNIIILNSSSSAQPSRESEKWGGGHGVFSYYLISGLQGGADENKNGIVDIRELYEFIRTNVAKDTENKQWPELKGSFNDKFPMSVVRPR